MMQLVIFDVDGTLAHFDINEAPAQQNEVKVNIYPDVIEWFAANASNYQIAFASNKGNVGLRYWMETGNFGDPSHLPTEEQSNAQLETVKKVLLGDQECRIYKCFRYQSKKTGKWSPTPYDKQVAAEGVAAATSDFPEVVYAEDNIPGEWSREWRKPNPGMLNQALIDYGYQECREHVIFVGNSDTDQETASAVGIRYVDRNEFFARRYTFRYNPEMIIRSLSEQQRIGLNLEITQRRFREAINKILSASYPVHNVTTFVEDTNLDCKYYWGYELEPRPNENTEAYVLRRIKDMYINQDWLTYNSAEEHAKAMANALTQDLFNHAVILTSLLMKNYNTTTDEAEQLVKKYKDQKAWSSLTVTL